MANDEDVFNTVVWDAAKNDNPFEQDEQDDEFSSVVMTAAWNGKVDELVAVAASHLHLIDTPRPGDWSQQTPLHVAAQSGHVSVIEKLIELGSQAIDSPDDDGSTPLYAAARNGHVPAIETLVRLGSNAIDTPNDNEDGRTPLCVAAFNGHSSVIELLVRLGSNAIDTPDNNGHSPAFIAVLYWKTECLNALRWLGADCSNIPTDGMKHMSWILQAPVNEYKAAEIRYRVFFSQSLVGRLLCLPFA